jgi:hypothetical protein
MITLPITEIELKKIIKILQNSSEKDLYNKLWTFNFNRQKN